MLVQRNECNIKVLQQMETGIELLFFLIKYEDNFNPSFTPLKLRDDF